VNVPQVGDNTGEWGTLGSKSERKRANGTIAYRAAIVVRKAGKRQRLSQTFDREATARHWMKRRKEELRKPGGLWKLEKTRAVTLSQAIEHCIAELTQIGRTNAKVLLAL
jgi:transcriptional regulator with GAF, ATPase, and Fis domain